MTTSTAPRRTRSYVSTGRIGRTLTKAAQIQTEIQRLKADLDDLRQPILQHMLRHKLDVIDIGSVEIIRKQRHNWTYSPETQREMNALVMLQRFEQEQKVATDTPKDFIAIQVVGATK